MTEPVADAAQRARLTERSLVDGLIRMIKQRDALTATHLDATGLLAAKLATALGYGPDEVDAITSAGRLHDIGKQTLSLDIIHKPGKLDVLEWREMKMHPHFGATIVAGFEQLAKYRNIIRSHHERIDGRGYPDRLGGSEIPVESRIIAIADAFHAMTVKRPYLDPRTPDDALEELLACRGTQFDADYVDVFVETMGFRRSTRRSA